MPKAGELMVELGTTESGCDVVVERSTIFEYVARAMGWVYPYAVKRS